MVAVGTFWTESIFLLPGQNRVKRKLKHVLKPVLFNRSRKRHKVKTEGDLCENSVVKCDMGLVKEMVVVPYVVDKGKSEEKTKL